VLPTHLGTPVCCARRAAAAAAAAPPPNQPPRPTGYMRRPPAPSADCVRYIRDTPSAGGFRLHKRPPRMPPRRRTWAKSRMRPLATRPSLTCASSHASACTLQGAGCRLQAASSTLEGCRLHCSWQPAPYGLQNQQAAGCQLQAGGRRPSPNSRQHAAGCRGVGATPGPLHPLRKLHPFRPLHPLRGYSWPASNCLIVLLSTPISPAISASLVASSACWEGGHLSAYDSIAIFARSFS